MRDLKTLFENWNTKTIPDCDIQHLLEAMGITPQSFWESRQHFYDIDQFFEHEHLLTKHEIFWWCCSFAYSAGGRWDEKWLDVFSRYDRLDHHFNKKLTWCNYFRRDETEKFYDLLKRKNQNDDLKVYRTFKVRKGHAVRKGVKKLDNPDALIQEEGMGSSFSFSKIFAYWFLCHQHNTYFYSKYGGITDREEQKRQLNIFWEGRLIDEEYEAILAGDSYACVGVYSLKKKDILMVMANNEEEIIADPNTVDVIRYDFITLAEALAGHWAEQWLRVEAERSGVDRQSWEFDEDELLGLFTGITKRMYEEPELLKSLYQNREDKFSEWWKTKRKELFVCLSFDKGGNLIGKDKIQDQGESFSTEMVKELIGA